MATRAAGTMPEPPKISCTGWGRPADHGTVCPQAIAETKCYRDDCDRAGIHGLLRDQLDSADDDGGEHHDGRTAKNTLGHDGDQGRQLREEATENQEDCSEAQSRAVDDLCHGDKANVLAEGSVRENAEQSSQGRTEAVAGHAAGELFIRSFSAHTALHNAGDIADGLDCCHNEHDQDRQDCPGIEDQFYRHEFWNGEPGSVGYLGPVQHPGFGKFHALGGDVRWWEGRFP